jgi:hypothetical protein
MSTLLAMEVIFAWMMNFIHEILGKVTFLCVVTLIGATSGIGIFKK